MYETLRTKLDRAASLQRAGKLLEEANQAFINGSITSDEVKALSSLYNKVRERLLERKPQVLLVEETHKDLGNAHTYGQITVLLPESSHRPSIWEDEFKPHVKARLDIVDFNPERDYLLVVGNQVATSTVIACLATKYSRFKVLFWHAQVKEYLPRTFDFGVRNEE